MCTWAHICKESTGPLRTKVPVSLLLSSIAELKRPSRKRPPPPPLLSLSILSEGPAVAGQARAREEQKWRGDTRFPRENFPVNLKRNLRWPFPNLRWREKKDFCHVLWVSDGEGRRKEKKDCSIREKKLGEKDWKKCWENWSIGGGGRSGWFLYHQERKLRFSRRDGEKYFFYFCWQKKERPKSRRKGCLGFRNKKG